MTPIPSLFYQICERLQIEGPATQSRLGGDFGKKKTMTAHLKRLESFGYVSKLPTGEWASTGLMPSKYGDEPSKVIERPMQPFNNLWAYQPLVEVRHGEV